MKEYEDRIADDKWVMGFLSTIRETIGISVTDERFTRSEEFLAYKESVERNLNVFTGKAYQLGGLDLEIDLIVELLANFREPSVLEVGVSNGYSSSLVYKVLDENKGKITSIDYPRFHKRSPRPTQMILEYLARRGELESTGTLGDVVPGGVIPPTKYASWLVDSRLRYRVPNVAFFGYFENIIQDMPDGVKFDFVIVDAMKDYKSRYRLMEITYEMMNQESLFFLDGYWVNSAFDDFVAANSLANWKFGRVGAFAKR